MASFTSTGVGDTLLTVLSDSAYRLSLLFLFLIC